MKKLPWGHIIMGIIVADFFKRMKRPNPLFQWSLGMHAGIGQIAIGFAVAFSLATCIAEDGTAQEAIPWATTVSSKLDLGQLNSSIQNAVQRAKPACVAIRLRHGNQQGTFSGVLVSQEGHVFTAGHCMEPGFDYEVVLDDQRTFKAHSLGRSTYLDCGMIQIVDPSNLPWVEMGKSADLVRYQPCLSISHPGGDDSHHGLVVRFGYVIDIHERGHIHNTCLMEPGDSGGGLFDLEGRLIGIRSYILKPLSANFDIPIDSFREHWDALCQAEEFNPPYAAPLFGIGLKSDRATDAGAHVVAVVEGSPAAEAGLQAGDWITRIHQTKVTAGFRIARELRRRMDGGNSDLALEIRRNDQAQAVTIKRHLPEHPETKEDPTARYDAMARLAEELSSLEDVLDNCTVRITSTVNENEIASLGTVLHRDGLVVSKNSRIGESPAIWDHLEKKLPARVVARDEGNDLALLQVDGPLEGAMNFNLRNEYPEGTILLSPRPGEADGLVSVIGSKPFPSPRKIEKGYLGVGLEMLDNRVIVRQIMEGPAKQMGLKPNDVVLKIDNQPVTTVPEMIDTIGAHAPGQAVRILVNRGEIEKEFLVTLAGRSVISKRHIADEFAGGPSLRCTGFDAVFCHDAHAEPHECGGPIFDIDGHFVGLNIARFSRTRCYALPAKIVRQFVEEFEANATTP